MTVSYVDRFLPINGVTVRWNLREVDGGFRPKFDPAVLTRLTAGDGAARHKEMLWEGFRNIECPMLLLRAELSDVVSPESVRLMQAARPQLQVVEIPAVGHPPALTEAASQKAFERFFLQRPLFDTQLWRSKLPSL